MRIGKDYRLLATHLASIGLAAALGLSGVAWAADAGSGSDDSAELKQQVLELRQELKELRGEIGAIKAQDEVKTPAAPPAGTTAAAPAPATVGEHVGAIEKDVADIRPT